MDELTKLLQEGFDDFFKKRKNIPDEKVFGDLRDLGVEFVELDDITESSFEFSQHCNTTRIYYTSKEMDELRYCA